MEKSIFFY